MDVIPILFGENIIPNWIKFFSVLFILYLVPVYYKQYGLANFLWFSDLALFGTVLAILFESDFLISMMAVGLLLPELAWNFDFFVRLSTGKKIFGLSDYMFDDKIPFRIRLLSLFHVALPIIWILFLVKFGYNQMAIYPQIVFSWLVLLLTYSFTNPKENINWVFGFGSKPQNKIHAALYLIFVLILFPVVIFVPTHFLLIWLFN
jgi:hypothetical protein